jgi:hypothetical protein
VCAIPLPELQIRYPINAVWAKKDPFCIFYLCENAQNSHTFYSIWVLFFFSEWQYPWPPSHENFISRLCPWQCNSGRHWRLSVLPELSILHPLLYCRGQSQLKKFSWENGYGYCLSENKKPNWNRATVVGVLSVLAKVKTVLIRTDCVNGFLK